MSGSYTLPSREDDPVHTVRTIARIAQILIELRDEYVQRYFVGAGRGDEREYGQHASGDRAGHGASSSDGRNRNENAPAGPA